MLIEKRSCKERTMIEQDDDRKGNGDPLGTHAKKCASGCGKKPHPPTAPGRTPPTSDRTIQSQQIEQPHHGFGALDHVGHTSRLQRVRDPKNRDDRRDPSSGFPHVRTEPVIGQGAPYHAQEAETRRQMYNKIDQMEAPRIRHAVAHRRIMTVDCQRQIHNGTPSGQGLAQRP